MICPSCGSHLSKKKVHYCTIYYCISCDGVWVEKEVFSRLAVILSCDEKIDVEKLKLFKPREVAQGERKTAYRTCPKCSAAMKEFNFGYDSNIFLDKCMKCGGIWADAGEMVQVARHIKVDADVRLLAEGIIEKPYLKQFEKDANMLSKILGTTVYAIGSLF